MFREMKLSQAPVAALLGAGLMMGAWCAAEARERSLLPQGGEVRSLAFSADGRLLASSGLEGRLRFWDVATGQTWFVRDEADMEFYCLAMSREGDTLAVGRGDGRIDVWDTKAQRLRRRIDAHENTILSIAFSLDGRTIASGDFKGSVKLWEAASGRLLRPLSGEEGRVKSIVFAPDSQSLVAAGEDRTIRHWNAQTGDVLTSRRFHRGVVAALAISPDGRTLASGGEDQTINLWDFPSLEHRRSLDCRDHVFALQFSPDGKRLVAGLRVGMQVWDPREGNALSSHLEKSLPTTISAAAFSRDGSMLAVGGADRLVRLIDVVDGNLAFDTPSVAISACQGIVRCLAFSPDGATLVSGGADHAIRCWDPATGKKRAELSGHQNEVFSLAVSPDGSTLVSGGRDMVAMLWDLGKNEQLGVYGKNRETVNRVAITPDRMVLVQACLDGAITLIDFPTGKDAGNLRGHRGGIKAIAVSPDSRLLASAAADDRVIVWDLPGKTRKHSYPGQVREPRSLDFTPDGQSLLIGTQNGDLVVWNLTNGEDRRSQGSGGTIMHLRVAPDGRRVLLARWPAEVEIWDLPSLEKVGCVTTQSEGLWSLAMSADGKRFATGDEAGNVKIWDMAAALGITRAGLEPLGSPRTSSPVASPSMAPAPPVASGSGPAVSPSPPASKAPAAPGALPASRTTAAPASSAPATASSTPAPAMSGPASAPASAPAPASAAATSAPAASGAIGPSAADLKYFQQTLHQAEGGSSPFAWTPGSKDNLVPAYYLAFSPDGRYLCTGNENIHTYVPGGPIGRGSVLKSGSKASARLWDLQTGREVRRFIGHPTWMVRCAAFSPDGRLLATTGFKHTRDMIGIPGIRGRGEETRLWDARTGEELRSWELIGWTLAFSGDGKRLITVDQSKGVSVIDVDSGVIENSFALKNASDVPPIGAPDGQSVVFAAQYGGNLFWETYPAVLNLATGEVERKFKGPKSPGVECMTLSQDGRLLASAAGQATIVWDYNTAQEIRRFDTGAAFLAFTPDARCLALITGSGERTVYELETGKVLHSCSLGRGPCALSPDGRVLAHGDKELGCVDLLDAATGTALVRLHQFDAERHWLTLTADRHFVASATLLNSWTAETSPEKAGVKLAQAKVESLCRALSRRSVAPPAVDPEAPTAELKLLQHFGDAARIQARAVPANKKARIVRIELLLDGRPVFFPEEKRPADQPSGQATLQIETTVKIPPGTAPARLAAVAIDSEGRSGKPAVFSLERPKGTEARAGRLFVLVVGVAQYKYPEYKLSFPDKDAEALAEFFRNQRGLFYSEVLVQQYTNQEATAANVTKGLEWLRRSCTPADGAVVFFAGHGVRGRKGLYYFTHEGDAEAIQYTCLNWSVVAESLAKTQARQILFLSDCCHAGAFAKERIASQDSLAEELLQKAGVIVFAASKGEESSLEKPAWGHGAFTLAMLEALSGKADAGDKDGRITIREIYDYVRARVGELSDTKQTPTIANLERFDPEFVVAGVRK